MPRPTGTRASLLARLPCFYTVDAQPWVSKTASGSTEVDFMPLFRCERADICYHNWEQYQSIVFQTPYQNHSFEELRLADYIRTEPTADQTESGCTKDSHVKPSTVSSILSLPEELITAITNHLQLKDLGSFRLANQKLAQASSYAIVQRMPLDKHIPLTETGLRSFLPVSRNYEVGRRISTIRLDARFLVAATHGADLEHECHAYPGLADCPIQMEKGLVEGRSEVQVRLLTEILQNLENLRRIELQAFPVNVSDRDGVQSFRAWYPMSWWPFKSVVAAMQAADTHASELEVKELMYHSWQGVEAELDPPPTDACPPPCELGTLRFLKSLEIKLVNILKLKEAVRHPSMFRHMRALLSAAAPNVERLSISSGSESEYQREVLQGVLGDGMQLPKLKHLSLTKCRVTSRILEDLVLVHAPALEYVEIESCLATNETCELLEQRGIELRVAGPLSWHFPSQYKRREKDK